MLHELLAMRQALFASTCLDPISTYERKLEIIQRNLYGVDIDPFAVNIARLRLWLSLAVDFDGDNPPPLPNLDYKIEVGDSLLAPAPGAVTQGSARSRLVEQMQDLKAQYLTAHHGEKRALKARIDQLKQDITLWTHGGASVQGFDWPVEFANVFTVGGFDVVLANPPYVRADAQYRHILEEDKRLAAIARWKTYRSRLLRDTTYETLYEKWDLYIPFLERGYQLLGPGGQMIFIVPDSYNTAKYAARSHEYFVAKSRVQRVDFCTDIPLFEAGVANTIVHFAHVSPVPADTPIRARRWGGGPEDFEANVEILPSPPQSMAGSRLFRSENGEGRTIDHQTIQLGSICYISYGLRANAADRYWRGEFVTEDLVSDVRDDKHCRPFVEGKDLARWWVKRIRYLEWGTDRAPAKFARPTFPLLHEAPEKLMALVVATGWAPVVLDTQRLVSTHTCCIFVPWCQLKGVRNRSIRKTTLYRSEALSVGATPGVLREELEAISTYFEPKYLLGVMNSSYAQEWLADRRRSKNHVYPDDWKPLPIPLASKEHQAEIASLVDQIRGLYQKHGYPLQGSAAAMLTEFEVHIDRRVAALCQVAEAAQPNV